MKSFKSLLPGFKEGDYGFKEGGWLTVATLNRHIKSMKLEYNI